MTCARVMRGISSMAKAATPASAMALSAALVAVGVHDRDDERAALQPGELAVARPAHLEHDVGVARQPRRRSGRASAPAASNSASGMPAFAPAPACDRHVGAERLVLLHRLGRRGDARLDRVGFGKNRDPHQAPLVRGGRLRRAAAVIASKAGPERACLMREIGNGLKGAGHG